jgi:membrane fusion protein
MSSDNELYRSEALAFASTRQFGTVEISQPVTLRVLTLVFLLSMIAIAAFVVLGEYARKQTVSGYIEPTSGVIRIRSTLSGVAKYVYVKEGDTVEQDQALVLLSSGQNLNDGEEANQVILDELYQQRSRLESRLMDVREQAALDAEWYKTQQHSLADKLDIIKEQIDIQSARVDLFREENSAVSQLNATSLASDTNQRMAEATFLAEKQILVELERIAANLRLEISQSSYQLERLPLLTDNEITTVENQLSNINKEITVVLERTEFTLKAPSGGVVTLVNVKQGDPVQLGLEAVALVNPESQLQVVLHVPSRAVGFLEVGQSVRIMYDSFPFQKFGSQTARIREISKTSLSPSDFNGPFIAAEPVFLVKADLGRSTLRAYGQDRKLQVGMNLSAEVVLENRTLIEWILEPVFTLRGRETQQVSLHSD